MYIELSFSLPNDDHYFYSDVYFYLLFSIRYSILYSPFSIRFESIFIVNDRYIVGIGMELLLLSSISNKTMIPHSLKNSRCYGNNIVYRYYNPIPINLSSIYLCIYFSMLNNPHTVRFLGLYKSAEGETYIVTEYLSKGSLDHVLMNEGPSITVQQLVEMYVHNKIDIFQYRDRYCLSNISLLFSSTFIPIGPSK